MGRGLQSSGADGGSVMRAEVVGDGGFESSKSLELEAHKYKFWRLNKMSNTGDLKFDHVHVYADSIQPLHEYKALEDKMNRFDAAIGGIAGVKHVAAARADCAMARQLLAEGDRLHARLVVWRDGDDVLRELQAWLDE